MDLFDHGLETVCILVCVSSLCCSHVWMEVVHHKLLISLLFKFDKRISIVSPVVATSHNKNLISAIFADSCNHIKHTCICVISMDENIGFIVVWLIVKLIENMIVSSKGL